MLCLLPTWCSLYAVCLFLPLSAPPPKKPCYDPALHFCLDAGTRSSHPCPSRQQLASASGLHPPTHPPLIHTRTLARTHARTHASARARAHTHTHTLTHLHTYTHMQVEMLIKRQDSELNLSQLGQNSSPPTSPFASLRYASTSRALLPVQVGLFCQYR